MKLLLISFLLIITLVQTSEAEVKSYNPYAFTNKNILEDDNSSLEDGYIDSYQEVISEKVHEWGVDIDGMVYETYNFFGGDLNQSQKNFDINRSLISNESNQSLEINNSNIEKEKLSKKLQEKAEIEIVDELFLPRRLLEERDRSYVRVSFVQRYHSLEDENMRLNVRARLGLGRSKKRLKLFIEDFNDDSAKNIGNSGNEDSPSIGIENKSKKIFGIRPRYSIGFKGIDPFVRARYNYKTNLGSWQFEPVQTFIYSLEDEFSEKTEVYLDRSTSENTLLRFVVDRGTESRHGGMNYDGFVQWFWTLRKHQGLSLNLGFNGHTKYKQLIKGSDPSEYENKNKVFNYLFILRWRENIFRKWLFYEIGPGVNYHQTHDYRPNYNIYFGIDLFFGHV